MPYRSLAYDMKCFIEAIDQLREDYPDMGIELEIKPGKAPHCRIGLESIDLSNKEEVFYGKEE